MCRIKCSHKNIEVFFFFYLFLNFICFSFLTFSLSSFSISTSLIHNRPTFHFCEVRFSKQKVLLKLPYFLNSHDYFQADSLHSKTFFSTSATLDTYLLPSIITMPNNKIISPDKSLNYPVFRFGPSQNRYDTYPSLMGLATLEQLRTLKAVST